VRLYDALSAYSRTGAVPLHMPGHKRRPEDYLVGAALDITEIDGFDNLHQPEGLLRDAMAYAAGVWGAEHSAFCVNGSTGGILSAIHACAGRGEKILVARNCHKSVWHAIELCRLTPVVLTPPMVEDTGIFASIPPKMVEDALQREENVALVVITSPTYEGVISDIAGISAAAHRHGVPVLVDEAHGAHLGFGPFPLGAVRAGADIVIQSLHKTLPSLTQTAIAHVQGDLVEFGAFLRSKNIFETSSPSYLLMASCDGCAHLLAERPAQIEAWYAMLADFSAQMQALRHLRLLYPTDSPAVFSADPSKLIVSVRGTDMTGPALLDRLRREFGIELEMASAGYALAMTGLGTVPEHLDAFAGALLAIDATCRTLPADKPIDTPPVPHLSLRPADAISAPQADCPLHAAEGKIAAGYLWAYPPGIPLILPGQRIDAATLAYLAALRENGVALSDRIAVLL